MTQKIRLWDISSGQPNEIANSEIRFEENLETWLENDISVLVSNLLVIGRQVSTDFAGLIDLLCIDSDGDLVVIELKKGQTPRDVTAQALDYASWAQGLSYDRIKEIADDYFEPQSPSTLDEAFQKRFHENLPETLNAGHRVLVVAESTDASTERIVSYLSERGVPINVATVQHFKDEDGQELLAQVFLVEPEIAAVKEQSRRRSSIISIAEQEAMADTHKVRHLYDDFLNKRPDKLHHIANGRRGFTYRVQNADGGWLQAVKFRLDKSNADVGIPFELRSDVFISKFVMCEESITDMLPESAEITRTGSWTHSGYFRIVQEIARFTDGVKQAGA